MYTLGLLVDNAFRFLLRAVKCLVCIVIYTSFIHSLLLYILCAALSFAYVMLGFKSSAVQGVIKRRGGGGLSLSSRFPRRDS